MKVKMEEEGLVAVIVGIDGYKDKKFRPLQCAVNDAVSLTETLKKVWEKPEIRTLVWPQIERAREQEQGWGIQLPENANNVTRENILENVRYCAARCQETDTFIFYFSGHGILIEDEPTLITVADGKTGEGTDYIKIRDIQKAAASGKCKKVMILDCCQGLTDNAGDPKGYKRLKDLSENWWIFLSCSPGESSLEDQYSGKISDDYLQQGIFTASLVEGLRGEAGTSEKGVTLTQLTSFVGKRVPIEYQERMKAFLSRKGKKITVRNPAQTSQNPVLIGEGFAVGGPYQVIMAPCWVPPAQKLRKTRPSKSFIKYWFRYLFGQWPILFPLKQAFRVGGALLYAAVMLSTVIWQSALAGPTSSHLLFWSLVVLGSIVTWWLTLSFAVAINEERWFVGGYLTLLFYLLWHGIVFLGFGILFGIEPHPLSGIPKMYYLGLDLFLIFVAVTTCGCNTSQTVIAIAETLRSENKRGDIRQAIRVFQEFKTKTFGASLYNYIPMVSAKPVFYYWCLGISIMMVGFNLVMVTTAPGTDAISLWMLMLRNLLALALIAWLVIWYAAAFTYLQKEVYKR
jgi:hypothetical protein